MRRELLTAAALVTGTGAAIAQDGGTQFVFGLTSEVRASDNWTMEEPSPGDSFQFNNALSFGISSATRASSIDINLGMRLHATEIAGQDQVAGVADPYANVAFVRSGADGALRLNASVAATDRDIDLSDSTGSSITGRLGGVFTFGESAPFGGRLAVDHSETQYDDGATADDERTSSASASLSLHVTPNMTLRPSASVTHHEVDAGPTETTETTRLGLGASFTINEALTFDASATNVEIDSSTSGDSTSVTYAASLTSQVVNGTHTIGASTDWSSAGRRTSVNYLRSLELDGNEARFGIGVTEASDGEQAITANVSFTQTLSSGTLAASVDRGYVTGADGTETLSTAASLDLSQDLSDVASVNLSASYEATQDTGSEADQEATVMASYNRSIGEDWDLSAGVEHRVVEDAGADRIQSNTVFLRFARSWLTRR